MQLSDAVAVRKILFPASDVSIQSVVYTTTNNNNIFQELKWGEFPEIFLTDFCYWPDILS